MLGRLPLVDAPSWPYATLEGEIVIATRRPCTRLRHRTARSPCRSSAPSVTTSSTSWRPHSSTKRRRLLARRDRRHSESWPRAVAPLVDGTGLYPALTRGCFHSGRRGAADASRGDRRAARGSSTCGSSYAVMRRGARIHPAIGCVVRRSSVLPSTGRPQPLTLPDQAAARFSHRPPIGCPAGAVDPGVSADASTTVAPSLWTRWRPLQARACRDFPSFWRLVYRRLSCCRRAGRGPPPTLSQANRHTPGASYLVSQKT